MGGSISKLCEVDTDCESWISSHLHFNIYTHLLISSTTSIIDANPQQHEINLNYSLIFEFHAL